LKKKPLKSMRQEHGIQFTVVFVLFFIVVLFVLCHSLIFVGCLYNLYNKYIL